MASASAGQVEILTVSNEIIEFTNTYCDVGRVEIFKNFPPLVVT